MKVPMRKIVRVYTPNGLTFNYPQTKAGVAKADARAVSESLGLEGNGEGVPVRVVQGRLSRLSGQLVRTHEIVVTARVVFADGHEVA